MNSIVRSSTRRSVLLLLASVLAACGGSAQPNDDSTSPSPSLSPAPAGEAYSTREFVVPFDVTVPDWLPAEVTTPTPRTSSRGNPRQTRTRP